MCFGFLEAVFYSCPPTAPNCLFHLRNINRTEPVTLGSCFNVLTAERRSGSVPFGSGSGRVLCSWTHAEGGEGGNGG